MAGVGEQLRQARLRQGIDLKEAENATKIRLKYLEALENEEFNVLPGRIYVIGFLRTYAKFLNIDSEKLVENLKSTIPDHEAVADQNPVSVIKVSKPGRNKTVKLLWLLILFIIIGIAIISFNFILEFFMQSPQDTIKPIPIETAPKNMETPAAPVDPPATPAQTQERTGIELIVIVQHDKSWISVEADGRQEFRGIKAAGEQLEIVAEQVIRINFGNAGVVRVLKNGEDQGLIGNPGQVVTKEYRAQN
ncbi:MAG: helix-turn-helix domain-containing protein [Syntrophomonadaceae bacterium]|nr:helix-turn-helix domain-containing protein [Syntrophomonadaceae bacterium]